MAKGARASSKKANRTKLRANVFGPVEQARAERLHAKLLETIAQPKPEKTDMETEETSAADDATKEEDLPKGSSLLTVPIPRSLSDPSSIALDSADEDCQLRNLCFHLGLCSDILGFTNHGHLKFAFDPLPPHWLNMDVDAAATSAKNSRKNKDKSQTRKQLRRRPQNRVSFPASRGKGALKPFTGGRTGGRVAKRRS
ncbi:unnamed protein product [Alternaria alternata]|uniref:DUF2423 domain-containing protein n=1 Tax=Alternaria alternata TaxID=5599 RepID=A0A177DP06_ALTAL|nr:hypothetical protein CC77DRAFT_1060856 [Alternaria alternata]XP_051588479.1 uncharacterized protein J4E82_005486 [Alternaria postmessia]KAI5375776.1 hypothetical protein J4E82_005486 [Alternaria postmessia]OAG21157.1 hypothetical protein CC77DRAFT_1060856 [Alternaria alternata]RII10290.1 hypothetical protein CUC08_Gglean006280 [Alternaria sp. MG1]